MASTKVRIPLRGKRMRGRKKLFVDSTLAVPVENRQSSSIDMAVASTLPEDKRVSFYPQAKELIDKARSGGTVDIEKARKHSQSRVANGLLSL